MIVKKGKKIKKKKNQTFPSRSGLFLSIENSSFVSAEVSPPGFRTDIMEKSSEMFERFGRLLEEDKVYLDLSCTFEDICGILGADSASFGRYVMEQVGMTGDEVLEVYRSGGRGGRK